MDKIFINDKPLYLASKAPVEIQHRSIAYNGRKSLIEAIEFLYNNAIESLYITHANIDTLQKDILKDLRCIEAAGGVVKNVHGELLFILRHGKWDLPKGKAEAGESMEETALREVEEECGISHLQLIRPLPNTYHIYKLKGEWVIKRTWWYFMQYSSTAKPVPQLEEDITEVRWFTINDLLIPFSNTYKSIANLMLTGFINTANNLINK